MRNQTLRDPFIKNRLIRRLNLPSIVTQVHVTNIKVDYRADVSFYVCVCYALGPLNEQINLSSQTCQNHAILTVNSTCLSVI